MPKSKDNEMTYEAAMTELRQTVAKLSEGKATLDESLKLYERGVELVGICENKLNENKDYKKSGSAVSDKQVYQKNRYDCRFRYDVYNVVFSFGTRVAGRGFG